MPDYYGVSQDEIWQREQESRSGMSSDEAIKRADLIDHLIANGNTDLAYDVAKGAYHGNGLSPQPGGPNGPAPYSDAASRSGDQGGYGSGPTTPVSAAPASGASEMAGSAPSTVPYVPGGIADRVSQEGSPMAGQQAGPDVYAAARSRSSVDSYDPQYGKMANAMGDQGGMEQSLYRPAARAQANREAGIAPAAARRPTVPYGKMANAQGDTGGYEGLTPYQQALMRRGKPVEVGTAPLGQQRYAGQPGVSYAAPGVTVIPPNPQTTYVPTNGTYSPPQQGFAQGPRGPQSSNFSPTVLPGGQQSMPGQGMPQPRAVVIVQADGSQLIYDTKTGEWRAQR